MPCYYLAHSTRLAGGEGGSSHHCGVAVNDEENSDSGNENARPPVGRSLTARISLTASCGVGDGVLAQDSGASESPALLRCLAGD